MEDLARSNTTLTLRNAPSATITAKAIAMVCLFTFSFIMGLLPIKIAKWFNWESSAKSKEVVANLLCFGGGVLFCTTFIHLLPEVTAHVRTLKEMNIFPDTPINFAETLMCIGFFFMYFVEECVHVYIHKREKKLGALTRTLSIRRGEMDTVNETDENSKPSDILVNGNVECVKNGTNHNHNDSHHHSHGGHSHGGHSHIMIADDSVVTSIRGLLVVLALSIHELFEGLAVGLESSSGMVWYMFGAVAAHKFVIAFCIGVELVSTKTKTLLTVIYVFTFSVVTPMGIGIGILVSVDKQGSTSLVSMILQGIATGTLLYVVFFEILTKENVGGMKRYLSVLIGFAVMFGLTLAAGHEHGGGGKAASAHHHTEKEIHVH